MKSISTCYFSNSKIFLLSMFMLFGSIASYGQALTGVKSIPGDYASLSSAVADLNAKGVGSGGVTFNVAAGYTETLSARLVVTATGTLSNPIIFQKNGVGANPILTSFVGSKLASSIDSVDVMWAFEGSDFVTIDGINLSESGANTTPTTMMEVGYGFYKTGATNGCSNNTVRNCVITLNRNNITTAATGPRSNASGSVGIEFVNATRQINNSAITVTATTGTSSDNRIYSNTIQNCNFGILLSGFAAAAPYTLADQNNDVGGTSALTGNRILNFGGGTGAIDACGAILINNQWSYNFSYNTVNNNNGSGVNHDRSNRGIWIFASSAGASCNINNNIITITAGTSNTAISWCLDFEMAQSGTGNTVNILNNQFLNCRSLAASTAAFTAIWLNTAATTVNVNNNYIYGFAYDGTGTTQCILSQLACGTLNINNNIIDSTVLTGATAAGTHYNIGITTAPTVALNVNNNTVTKTILNTAGAGGKTLYAIYYTGATPVNNFISNTVSGITRNGTTGGATIGIYQALGTNGTSTTTVRKNTINNFSITGTGATSTMYGIQVSTGTIIVDSNTVYDLSCAKSTGTGNLYGIYDVSSPNNENYSYNTVYNLTHAGTGPTHGINCNTATGVRIVSYNLVYNVTGGGAAAGISQSLSGPRIFNNRVYDITTTGTAATAIASGIIVTSTTSPLSSQVYNNIIGRIFAPASNGGLTPTVRGISITSVTTLSNQEVYYNTINLNATSTGAGFSSAGIFHTFNTTATTATLNMQNNIIVNKSVPSGTGITAAFWRSAATNLNNFNSVSNRNIFYAGTPSANNLIYYDATNSDQTLGAYQARVTPRDSASFTEDVSFLSTTGSSPDFLKLNPAILTNAEATARNIAGITSDFGNAARAGNTGYAGNSGAPDMGAWEGNYLGDVANQMFFDSANVDQQAGVIPLGSVNNPIIRIRVYVNKGYNSLEATALALSTATTSNVTDITNAKVYFTGSSPTFSTTSLFGTVANPTATFSVNGTQKLSLGINYFWVAYDISNTATGGNLVDAALTNITLSGNTYNPINGDPIDNRTILAPLSGNYDVGPGHAYTSLTSALTQLRSLGVTGPVTFTLKSPQYDSVATGEVFPILLESYAGASSTNTVTIRPDAGVASRIVSIGLAPTIQINGGSNFIIDGRQGGTGGFTSGNNLIIESTNKQSSTLVYQNDADSNLVYYVDIKGADTIAAGTSGAGVVVFGTTTGTLGNDRNIIRNCHIHESVSGNPAVGISSIGTGTTVSTNNDFITIDSCNIYDNFTGTTASAAIHVGANNSSWTIHQNKFYQTAIRTSTAAITNRVLWITPNTASLTSASGFVITNNFIGGNSSAGTGVYELRGVASHLFQGMDISVGLGAATQISNNTITNIIDSSSSTTSNTFVGINLANGNVNVTNNTIGSKTQNGSIVFGANSTTTGGIMGIRTGGGTNNTFNITDNIIGGISVYGNTTTTGPEFFGINVFNGTNINVSNNLIGDTILSNSIHIVSTNTGATTSQRVTGIFNNPSAAAVHNITNNVIANITNNYDGTSTNNSLTKGIVVAPTAAGTFTITGNLIRNISTASQTIGSGNNATLVGIGVNSTVGTFNVSGNTIYDLVLTGASTTTAVKSAGIFYSVPTSGTNVATRNLVHSLTLTANNPIAIISGIDIGGGNGTIANNMIRLGIDGSGLGINTAVGFRGITKGSGGVKVYFNTVYIGGTGVGAAISPTYAFQRTTAGTDDVRNNIFVNQRLNSSGGGGHFAAGLNNNTTLTMNYNILTGDLIGEFGGTSYASLTNWKSASGVDANSVSSPAGLLNPTGTSATLDLHINPAAPTPIESYGQVIVGMDTVDFDGQLRSGLTPVDLGADAGNFTPSDVAQASITYTALTNTISLTDRVLSAVIMDATGVYTTGALRPRIYYKKSALGAWNSTVGVLTTGDADSGVWQFTINYTPLGGVVGDDSIYYFVIAQDSTATNNIGSFPGGAEATNVNTISVYPTPFNYKITPILGNTTILVGAGNPFTNFTGTDGLFNYLNAAVLNGNLTIKITSDIEETGQFGLNEMAEIGAGGYRINIEPDANSLRSITGSYGINFTGLFRLTGADRVKIDGSFNGSGKFIRFMNRNQGSATIDLLNDSDNDTITNVIIEGTNNTVGMLNFFGSTKVGGTGNDSNAVIGCIFKDTTGTPYTGNIPNTGIASQGTASLGNDFNTIRDNEIYNFGFNGININSTGGDFWTIANNSFYQVIPKNNAFAVIVIGGGAGHSITGNSIGGSNINRTDTAFRTTSTFIGINILSASTGFAPVTIANNTISNVSTTSTLTGVNVTAAVLATLPIVIHNNSLYRLTPTTGACFGISVSGGASTVTNNYLDTLVTGTSNGAIHFAGGAATTTLIENNSIFNLFYNGTGLLRTAGISVSTTNATSIVIRRNTIRNISGANTGTAASSTRLGGIVAISAPPSGLVISDNDISGIRSTNAGIVAYAPVGIHVTSTTGTFSILRNRIKNINSLGTGTGTAAPVIQGIQIASSSTGCVIANNQVMLGDSVTNQCLVMGISDYSTGNNTFAYNSVLVNGTTAAGANHSYGFFRNSTATVNLRNNILYNKRTTLGTGNNYAVGSASATGISGSNINYNLMIVNDTNRLSELPAGTPNGWAALNSLYTTTYNTNWAASVSAVPVDSLFIDTLLGNLGIVTANSHAWYANGKGIAMSGISGDYGNPTGVRSTTIATGSTDIGSVEFTLTTIPPVAFANAAPSPTTTTTYFFGSRAIARLNWDAIGAVPSVVDIRYYSGVNPMNVPGGTTFMNAYWDIQQSGGSGFEAVVTLMLDSAALGTVSNPANLNMALYAGSGTQWMRYASTSVNNVTGFFDTGLFTDSLGIFTGTDRLNNPLPVDLLRIYAKKSGVDAQVLWNTANEYDVNAYQIERSMDGKTFKGIGTVDALNRNAGINSYVYTDKNPFAAARTNTIYYRLKMVDVDGSFTYSPIVQLNNEESTVAKLLVYPNPFNQSIVIDVAGKTGETTISLYGIDGKLAASKQVVLSGSENAITLDALSTLDAGIYFLKVIIGEEVNVIKVVKD